MKFTMNKTILVLASLSLFGSTSVIVADNSTISGTPATTVELGNLDAITLGTMSLGQEAQGSLCVYSNSGTSGAYQVTFTSNEGSFKLVNGSDEIPYEVSFSDRDDTDATIVGYNSTLTAQDTGGIVAYPCTADNARIIIELAADAIEAVPAQAYSGTLTMVVAAP